MKALLLAAGKGERLGDITKDVNKCSLMVGGKPLIRYSLDHMFTPIQYQKITELVVVVGYKADTVIPIIQDWYYEKGIKNTCIKLTIIRQELQSGMLDAILCAEDAIDKSDFVLVLGDEIVIHPNPVLKMLSYKDDIHCMGVIGYVLADCPERVSKTFSIDIGIPEFYAFMEKPMNPDVQMMGTGYGLFDKNFFDCARVASDYPNALAIYSSYHQENVSLCQLGFRYYNINSEEDLIEARKDLTITPRQYD